MTGDSEYTTRAYHEATKHHRGLMAPSRRVDAALIPSQTKRYLGLLSLALPAPGPSSAGCIDESMLSTLLHYTAGIIRRSEINDRMVEFRAASCTGALYHVEVYVVCGSIGSLPAGVYHYDVMSESLRPLRHGDHRPHLAAACADAALANASATLLFTSTFWRNAWRYEERAYRHAFWDTGTMIANLLALTTERDLEARVLTAFVDDEVNTLLGVDPVREATVCVLPVGPTQRAPSMPHEVTALPSLDLETAPLSRAEIEYPLIWRTHESSALDSAVAVSALRGGPNGAVRSHNAAAAWRPAADEGVSQVIERRVSARRFKPAAIARHQLSHLLDAATAPVSHDLPCHDLVDTYLLAHALEGVDRGAHYVSPGNRLQPVRTGDLRSLATDLALDQDAAGAAALNFYFTVSLRRLEARLGERGYRAAQLEAGVRCGRVYLAATALGLKATGLTFYDDEVATTLGLDPLDTAVLMLVAAGP